jgi:hypothetical protein
VKNNLIVLTLTIVFLCLIGGVNILPWWTFVVPVGVLGAIYAYNGWKISAFPIGVLAGFLVWCGGELYYDIIGKGLALDSIAQLITVPKIVVIAAAGILGGLLNGTALLAGYTAFTVTTPRTTGNEQ